MSEPEDWSMDEPTPSEIMAAIRDLEKEVKDLSKRVGKEIDTDQGPRGDGLTGRVIAAERKLAGILALKTKGTGIALGAFIVLAVFVLGIKQAIAALLGGVHH